MIKEKNWAGAVQELQTTDWCSVYEDICALDAYYLQLCATPDAVAPSINDDLNRKEIHESL